MAVPRRHAPPAPLPRPLPGVPGRGSEASARGGSSQRLIAGPWTVYSPPSAAWSSTLVTDWFALAKSLAGWPPWRRPAYFTVALPCGEIVGRRRTYAPFTHSVGV